MPDTPTWLAVDNSVSRLNWERDLHFQAMGRLGILDPKHGFIGKGAGSLCQTTDAAFSEGGTRATITLIPQINSKLVLGNQILEGNEGGLDPRPFTFDINLVRSAVKIDGEIVPNRVTWNVAETSKTALADRIARATETALMMQLTGYTIDTGREFEPDIDGSDLASTFCNTPRAAASFYNYRPNGLTTDAAVGTDTSAKLDLEDIAKLVARARVLPHRLRPITVKGFAKGIYVLFVHPNVAQYWREPGSQMYDLVLKQIQGGDSSLAALGAIAFVHNTLVVESDYLPPGISGSSPVADTRRSVFCGAQALCLGRAKTYASGNTPESMFKMVLNNRDYGDKRGLGFKSLLGAHAPWFTVPLTEGTQLEVSNRIVVCSYAADLSGWT